MQTRQLNVRSYLISRRPPGGRGPWGRRSMHEGICTAQYLPGRHSAHLHDFAGGFNRTDKFFHEYTSALGH